MTHEEAVTAITSRERILQSLDHREPDRLPLFGPNIIDTHESYDAGLQEFLRNFDFDGFAGVGGLVNPPTHQRALPDNTFVDGYGCRYK